MNAPRILNNIVSLVSFDIHKARQKTLRSCVESLLDGYSASVTSIGRGITAPAFEKHRIKRADRFLSNRHLQSEIPGMYAVICRLFCQGKHPVIAVDWSDLDEHRTHFLLRASVLIKSRPVTLYQEVHTLATKEKAKTHQTFLRVLYQLIDKDCKPVIVTDAGFRSTWFRPVLEQGWHIVGRVRKSHKYSLNTSTNWQCITELYKVAEVTPKIYKSAWIAKNNPFRCKLVLCKSESRGRHAKNADGSRKQSKQSEKYAQGADDPWLLATSLPMRAGLAKRVVSIYQQRMQIEEGFRDMKSNQFGLGFEYNKTMKIDRMNVLIFITTLASTVAILTGLTVEVAGKHKRFQANTVKRRVLSFHTLGLRAWRQRVEFTFIQWQDALDTLKRMIIGAAHQNE